MKDVINVLNALLKDLESTDSLEGLIHAVRDLINLIDSHEYLKTSIDELSKSKIQDQKHFENIAAAVVKDVNRAALELKKKIACSSR
jgi:sensor domain CHASE-containing protein